ncbi:MAG: type IV toxin-antitoxin system AbiEi family antitoxin domain-containing protein [Longimicrobiales bacterium]
MAYHNIISLSHAEAIFLTELAAKGKDIFTTRDAYRILGQGRSTRDTLERLVDKGWLERIERGKYLIVPLEAGPDRVWTEDALVIASHLVNPSMVAYWSALSHWNLTDQVPRVTYVQTPARKENRTPVVLGMRFRIVRVKEERFFGDHTVRVGESPVHVTDPEKTLIDCLDRPELSGGVAEVARALRDGDGEIDWIRATGHLRRFGSGAVVKRLGFLIESMGLSHPPDPGLLDQWQGLLTAGISPLDPSSSQDTHRIATRWRIGVNLPEGGLGAEA